MTEWILVAVGLVLIGLNGFFVAAEFSLITVDRATIETQAEAGDRRAGGVLAALRALSTQLSGAQLGITITSLAVGYIAEPSIASLLSPVLESAGVGASARAGIAVGTALFVATVVQMVLGELVPKNLAIARPLLVARAVTPPQRAFTALMGPVIRLLNGTANAIVRALGLTPQEELRSARSPEELSSLVSRSADKGTLATPTAGLITRTLAFGERTAADAMTPRVRVRFVPGDGTVDDVLDAARDTGHSRFPVLGGSVDDVIGMVHVKHALAVPPDRRDTMPLRDIMVPPVLIPNSIELDDLLLKLRERSLQMAVVMDEYGGTDGVITLEDLVEELVGDIADEHDRPGSHARHRADGAWSLSGLLRVDEIETITGIELPEDEKYDTLAGLMLDHLDHVPHAGEAVEADTEEHHVTLIVERMDGRRIDRVLVSSRPRPPDEPGDPDGAVA